MDVIEEAHAVQETAQPPARVPPPQSRFLFVDVSALRAKQLRRGARPRLPQTDPAGRKVEIPHKLERVAMEEVNHGLVLYELPDQKPEPAKERP